MWEAVLRVGMLDHGRLDRNGEFDRVLFVDVCVVSVSLVFLLDFYV